MRTISRLRWAVVILVVASLHVSAPSACAQENPQFEEIRSLLREASNLVPKIEPGQQSSAAANVARLQVMAGDMEGAMATTQTLSQRSDQGLAVEIMASALAGRGNGAQAVSMIEDRMQGPPKATAYLMVAQQLASRGDFTGAVTTARLIRGDDQQIGTFIDALMRIYWAQWKADDKAGARQTLSQALATVDEMAKNPTQSKHAIAELYRGVGLWLDQAGNSVENLPFVDRIQEFVDQEKDLGQRSLLLQDLAYAEINAGEHMAAIRTAEAIPSANERDFILDAVAMHRTKHDDPEGGLEIQNGISNQSLRRSCLEFAADRLAASNRYDRALSVLDTIPDAKDRAYALASLALQQAEREDRNALFTVQLAWTTALEAKPEAEHSVFEFIAVTRGILGDLSGALAIVDSMDANSRVWPLWNLTNMMVVAGRKDEALALARAQESAHPRTYAFIGIAQALLDQTDASRKRDQHR